MFSINRNLSETISHNWNVYRAYVTSAYSVTTVSNEYVFRIYMNPKPICENVKLQYMNISLDFVSVKYSTGLYADYIVISFITDKKKFYVGDMYFANVYTGKHGITDITFEDVF